jgi:hypothetical protein
VRYALVMSSALSGVVRECGNGFIVVQSGLHIRFTSQVFQAELAPGDRVIVKARLRGAEWVAEDIQRVESAKDAAPQE